MLLVSLYLYLYTGPYLLRCLTQLLFQCQLKEDRLSSSESPKRKWEHFRHLSYRAFLFVSLAGILFKSHPIMRVTEYIHTDGHSSNRHLAVLKVCSCIFVCVFVTALTVHTIASCLK